jgi:hypothetical protein
MNTRKIKHNGQIYEIPNNWEELVDSMTLKEIPFDSVKRDRFDENSLLIKLIDSYFQNQYSKGEFTLPELKTIGNESISIFSDYGGEHKGSKYNSYSLLFCGWNHCYPLGEDFVKLRQKYKLDRKEVSFKELSYGPTSRALKEYLDIIDRNVSGFLLTVLIDKDLPPLFIGKENKHLLEEIKNAGLGEWHTKAAEKLMIILHLMGYVLPLIAESNQKIIWLTDKDTVVQNTEMFNNAIKLFKGVMKIYSDNVYGRIGGARLPFDDKDIHTMDLLSITDLVAGSVEQYFTNVKTHGEPSVKNGADKIIAWLSSSGTFLKKEVVKISYENKLVSVAGIKFNKD